MPHRVVASRGSGEAVDPSAAMDRIVAEALVMIGHADGASIELRDGDHLEYVSATGSLAPFVGLVLRVDGSLSGLSATTGAVVRCDDAWTDPRVDGEAVRRTGVRSMLCVPLRVGDRIDAVLKVSATRPDAFTERDADDLRRLAEILSVAVTAAADLAHVTEERLELAEQLVELAEVEQRRLAVALHDDPVQRLTAALYQLPLLRRAGPSELQVLVDRTEQLVRDAVTSLRRLMFELAPPELDPAHVGDVLESAAEELFTGTHAELELDVRCERALDLRDAQLVYRIAVEALGNARRHAAARHVLLRARIDDAGVELDVVDDGAGFDPRSPSPGHLGLYSLHERARLLGGTVAVVSAPGGGTTIQLRVPPAPIPG